MVDTASLRWDVISNRISITLVLPLKKVRGLGSELIWVAGLQRGLLSCGCALLWVHRELPGV
jgi:hypothetical protein